MGYPEDSNVMRWDVYPPNIQIHLPFFLASVLNRVFAVSTANSPPDYTDSAIPRPVCQLKPHAKVGSQVRLVFELREKSTSARKARPTQSLAEIARDNWRENP
jgi:hypothetical protein